MELNQLVNYYNHYDDDDDDDDCLFARYDYDVKGFFLLATNYDHLWR
jgi:hypothetical protein